MKYFDEFKVDGAPLLVPDAGVNITKTDLDSAESGRDESGVMHRFVVRHRVKTWEFNYSALTKEEYLYMESLFDGKTDFDFTYLTPDGVAAVCRAYCSNSSISYFNAATGLYKNLKFSIIEC